MRYAVVAQAWMLRPLRSSAIVRMAVATIVWSSAARNIPDISATRMTTIWRCVYPPPAGEWLPPDGRRVLLYSCVLLVGAARVGQGRGGVQGRFVEHRADPRPAGLGSEGVEVVVEPCHQRHQGPDVLRVPRGQRAADHGLPAGRELAGHAFPRLGRDELYGPPVLRVRAPLDVARPGELRDVTAHGGGV